MLDKIEDFVGLSAGRLALFNIVMVAVLKLMLPYGSAGLATITEPLKPLDTEVVIQATNAARAQASLQSLTHNQVLDAAAAKKLEDMEVKGYFAHVSPEGLQPWEWIRQQGYVYRVAGENLARGFVDPQAVVNAWMGSVSHKANILNTQYRDIGVASKVVVMNGKKTTLVVQMFGTPQPNVPVAKPKAATIKPSATPGPVSQVMSTDKAIVSVQEPVTVTAPVDSFTAQVSRSLSSYLAIWLTGLLGVLTVCAVFIGFKRPLVHALAIHGVLLAALTVIPVLGGVKHLIF